MKQAGGILMRHLQPSAAWFLLLLASAIASGAPPQTASKPDALSVARKIDHFLSLGFKAADREPAPLADDAEFLRRIYLDLAGRIPSVAEARAFLADKKVDKRRRLIDALLSRPAYANHFANVWRAAWLPEAGGTIQNLLLSGGFEKWLRRELRANKGYHEMARGLLALPLSENMMDLLRVFNDPDGTTPSPVAFYIAKENKPEELAAATARLFLGARVECAQCHNHPFAAWKREQFWSLAAFFAGIKSQAQGDFSFPRGEDTSKRRITIPGTKTTVPALFLDGRTPKFQNGFSPRQTLVDWMTADDNPYFARAAVNRLWAYFFGAGLIEPVDEMIGAGIQASHPELLDELARQFKAARYDLKFLIRAITNSQAYQRTSAVPPEAPRPAPESEPEDENGPPRLFDRMPLRGLRPEQLFDSLAQATGYQEAKVTGLAQFIGSKSSPRGDFMARFAGSREKYADTEISILQALAMMNGKIVSDATRLESSETLAAVADAPFLTTAGRIEILYLATLSRPPRPDEMTRLVAYVDRGGVARTARATTPQYNRALADVFWALLNSSEFIFNH
jgi:hypothetical protein